MWPDFVTINDSLSSKTVPEPQNFIHESVIKCLNLQEKLLLRYIGVSTIFANRDQKYFILIGTCMYFAGENEQARKEYNMSLFYVSKGVTPLLIKSQLG